MCVGLGGTGGLEVAKNTVCPDQGHSGASVCTECTSRMGVSGGVCQPSGSASLNAELL